MSDTFLTLKETADELGVHWQTVRNYIQKGHLPAFKIGRTLRIRRSDIDKFVRSEEPEQDKQLHEIELRFLLPDRQKTEDKLRKLGAKISQHSHIIDYYFCANHIENIKQQDTWYNSPKGFSARIRLMDNDYSGRITTTMEVKKAVTPGNHNDLIESEIVVEDYEETKALLELMGYKQFLKIDKERLVYKLEDRKYCFDHIAGWGDAVEIEMMTALPYQQARKIIMKAATAIGLTEKDYIKTSHTNLAMKDLVKF